MHKLTETIGDCWRPLESSTDHWRPAGATGNQQKHWKQAETIGDQQRPLSSSRHHCQTAKPCEDQQRLLEIGRDCCKKKMSLETRTINGDLQRQLKNTADKFRPANTRGNQRRRLETSRHLQRPFKPNRGNCRPADINGDQLILLEISTHHLRPPDTT